MERTEIQAEEGICGYGQPTMREIRGITFRYYAQGMASIAWVVQDDRFIRPDGSWMFEGLYFLVPGDELIIYDADGKVSWSGIIPPQPQSGQTLPWLPKGVDRQFWWDLFSERRCMVRKAQNRDVV